MTRAAHLSAARKYLAEQGVPLDGALIDIADAVAEYLDGALGEADDSALSDREDLRDALVEALADALAPALVGTC